MRSRPLRLAWLVFCAGAGLGLPASAVVIDWTPVGAPGNACDPWFSQCYGDVAYAYQIGTYEVTNAQYAEFLNAVADDDPNALYNANMGAGLGGITRSGSAGSYSYSVIPGRDAKPVNYVDLHDTLRFANWLANGQPIGAQGIGTTESGSYTITPGGVTANSVTRNPGSTIVLANEDEWYKAAYFNVSAAGYFDYPTGTNTLPVCSGPTASANHANCGSVAGGPTDVGSYPGSPSPAGTYDQGGNVWEWNETILAATARGVQGGSYGNSASDMQMLGIGVPPTFEEPFLGFRVASIPEPSTGALVAAGLAALAVRGRARRGFACSR